MHGLPFSYMQSYNQRHYLTGHLFQGRYKAILCDREAYLLEEVERQTEASRDIQSVCQSREVSFRRQDGVQRDGAS